MEDLSDYEEVDEAAVQQQTPPAGPQLEEAKEDQGASGGAASQGNGSD